MNNYVCEEAQCLEITMPEKTISDNEYSKMLYEYDRKLKEWVIYRSRELKRQLKELKNN